MAFDPSTASLVNPPKEGGGGFDPSTASLMQPEQAPQQNFVQGGAVGQALANSPVMGAVSGLSNAGANIFEGAVDAGAWLFERLGAISPDIAQEMKRQVGEDMDKYFRSSDKTAQGDIANAARMNNPLSSSITQAVGEVAPLSRLNPTTGLAGTIGKAADLALQSGVGGLVNAGLAGPKTSDQDKAALVGMAIPPIIKAAGTAIKAGAGALIKKFGMADELRAQTAPINKELLRNNQMDIDQKAGQSVLAKVDTAKAIESKNFEQMKAIPGTVNPVDVQSNIQKLTQNKSLNGNQQELLSDLSQTLDKVDTMEKAIQLKQTIGRYGKNFLVPDVSKPTYEAYRRIATSLDDAIEARAKEFGIEGQWKKVNDYHKNTMIPLSDNGTMDIAEAVAKGPGTQAYQTAMQNYTKKAMATPASLTKTLEQLDDDGSKIMQQAMVKNILDEIDINPGAFDRNAALRKVNIMADRFKGVDAPDIKDALQGIKVTLEKYGATTEKAVPRTGEGVRMVSGAVGAALGQAVAPGSAGASALGASIGYAAGPALIQGMSKLLESPGGMFILKGIGQGKPWGKSVAKLLGSGEAPWNKTVGDITRGAALDITGQANRSPEQ